jgi:phosphoserine aminotransferase
MAKTYFTVGPAQLYPTFATHIAQAVNEQVGSISHRSEAFRKMYQHADEQLRALMNIPNTHSIFFAASATEIWERMILNTVVHKSAHFVSGAFGKKFMEFSKLLGKEVQVYTSEHGEGFPNLPEYKIDSDVELICTTQNETSSGVSIRPDLLAAIKQKYPNKLLCTDIVSSAPYAQIDFKAVDCAFFSVQKAFGMPAGLGVWIVNDACISKSETIINKGAHNTLVDYAKNYKNFETPSTPNTLGIYLLGKIAEDMNKVGIAHIRKTIDERAEAMYKINNNKLQPLVTDLAVRSKTTVVYKSTLSAKEWNAQLAADEFIVASGYGAFKQSEIRVANFPAISDEAWETLMKRFAE